jgi:PIN domain nuclease of toxin-antitoxin system
MKILLDTHYLIWSFTNPENLPPGVPGLLIAEDNKVYFSPASLWEISIKFKSLFQKSA